MIDTGLLLSPSARYSVRHVWVFTALLTALLFPSALRAQQVPTVDPPHYGPYNAVLLPGGLGVREDLREVHDSVLQPDSPWTMSCWFRLQEPQDGLVLIAGLGNVTAEYVRFLAVQNGRVLLWEGPKNELSASVSLGSAGWHLLSATHEGTDDTLFLDGSRVAGGHLTLGTVAPVLQIGPPVLTSEQTAHFAGKVASFEVLRRALSSAEIKTLASTPPQFEALMYTEASRSWPLQTRAQAGYRNPQDPVDFPTGRGPNSAAKAIPRKPMGEALSQSAASTWTFSDGWLMREASANAQGSEVSSPDFQGVGWNRATVPGTVLTTLIDDGVYPDPYYGLNNLSIPETLNKQSYWYRNVFHVPKSMQHGLSMEHHVDLTFGGINYAAEVWLNGTKLGSIKGAFLRGTFDVTGLLRADALNALAVKISPPPHPGIPQEQSLRGGPGENGGAMELDGPTFLATEGWDWLPAMRDRDAGIWQPVTLQLSGEAKLGDVQVVTTFRHHDLSTAALSFTVPVHNGATHSVGATVKVALDSSSVSKAVTLAPGENVVNLSAAEFPALALSHPRLWWPNGYGKPELYKANIELQLGDKVADTHSVRFGVREVTYELSLLDHTGSLRRIDYTPGNDLHPRTALVDVTHSGMREVPSADASALLIAESKRSDYRYRTVVSSLPESSNKSPAIESISADGSAPYLVIKVNGVRIAARGGNWGMDDARKRVSRERLEPYFRLHRDANLNIIRNWVGQNTEETFFELADEYGLMVWNDFWESTQDYNIEAEDPALFLQNAADVIQRYRNHPSIILWCGRNEGVPQPILNEGLESLVRTLDGTRFYSPSSNQINLQQSGPYSYQDPTLYYTTLNRGFSVETGTPSMPTLESFKSSTPKEDLWPIDDVWAYHDWHASGNGLTGPFMHEIESEFGAATSLEDFERKAQMLDYVDHRAIFEGMNANLWQPNSGRLLWMTQPAWPSTMWQILSSDYDTQASFYGTKKACEPVHVQLNLANHQVDIVNTTTAARKVSVTAKVYSLASNELLLTKSSQQSTVADTTSHLFTLDLDPVIQHGMALVELEASDEHGEALSSNLYWLGKDSAAYRELNELPVSPVDIQATSSRTADEIVVHVDLVNRGRNALLNTKLTIEDAKGQRILPAYYSDNYISLLPAQQKTIEIRVPVDATEADMQLALRGWNVAPKLVRVRHADTQEHVSSR